MKVEKINNILLFLFLFFLPTQLGKYYFFNFSYIFGVRVDYLAIAVFLTDIIFFLILLLNLKTSVTNIKKPAYILFVIGAVINICFSTLRLISLYRWLKILQVILIAKIFSKKKEAEQSILDPLLIGTIIELLLAVFQIINRQSLQGIFYYLGERSFNLSTPGIAKTTISGVEILRPYATFSHPNSMAGFYLLIYFFIMTRISNKHFVKKNLLLLLSSMLILLSFSKVAILTFLILNLLALILNLKKCHICTIARFLTLLTLSMVFIMAKNDPLSVEKRIELIKNSLKIIHNNWTVGVGLGNYVFSQKNFLSKHYLFFNQPVHNIFLLLLAEAGFFINMFFYFHLYVLIKNLIVKYWLIILVIIITGIFDHYWLTLQQNLLLLGVIVGIISAYQSSS